MINKNIKPHVIGPIFQGVSELLDQENINKDSFYQKFGIDKDIEQNFQALISFEVFINLLNELSVKTSIKHPGLYLANNQLKQYEMPYLGLISNAPTVEVALQLARRFRHVYSEVTYWEWCVEDNFAVITRGSYAPLQANDKEHSLYTIATVFLLLKKLLGHHAFIERISLIQPEDQHKKELEKFFNCSISFGQDFDGFILSEKNFYKPNDNFDAHKYHDLLTKLAHHKVIFPQNQQFSTFIKILILQTLSTGHCNLKSVASQIGMSPRSVQKRLLKEELTFKDVISDVRMTIANRLLIQPNVALIQISAILGYSEVSAFSRAFKSINNCSPRAWRAQHSIKSR